MINILFLFELALAFPVAVSGSCAALQEQSACEISFFLVGGNDERSSSTCRITVLFSTRLSFITSLDDTVGKFGWSWSSTVSASAGLSTAFNNNFKKFCINLTPEI